MAANKVMKVVSRSAKYPSHHLTLPLFLLVWWHTSIVTGQSLIQRLETSWDAKYFGSAIDFDDRTAVIGGRFQISLHLEAALISIFEKSDGRWRESTSILFPCGVLTSCEPSVDLDGDRPVAMDDNRILVGTGRAGYIFENTNAQWTQTATLVPPAIVGNSFLGGFVWLENDKAFISAYGYQGHGSVFMFWEGEDGQWNLTSTIEPLIPANGQEFGRSFSLDNNRLIVGAPNSPGGGDVYVFEFDGSTWNETAILHAFDGGTAGFGASVSLDGDRLIVNDGNLNDSAGFRSTSVYKLTDGAWTQVFVIPAERYGLGAASRMWDSVELRGNIALVGSGGGYAGVITVPETVGPNLVWFVIGWIIRGSRRRRIVDR